MTKKTKSAASKQVAVVVNTNSAPKQGKRRRRKRGSRRGSSSSDAPTWMDVVFNPFGANGSHIPDQDTRPSGLVTSRLNFNYYCKRVDGTSATQHNGGILMRPYLEDWVLQMGTDSSGHIQPNYYSYNINLNSGLEWTSVPNFHAIVGSYSSGSTPSQASALVRCVGMGMRIVYEGTELQRAGAYMGLAVNNIADAITFNTADSGGVNFHFDPLSVYTSQCSDSVAYTPSEWLNFAVKSDKTRISEGVYEIKWIPTGVPKYQAVVRTPTGSRTYTQTGHQTSDDTLYACSVGDEGLERASGGIMVLIENDTLASAAALGNSYSVECVAHWEVIPHDYYSITYEITPSDFAARELELALNLFARMSLSRATPITSTGTAITGSVSRIQRQRQGRTFGQVLAPVAKAVQQYGAPVARGLLQRYADYLLASPMTLHPRMIEF